MAEIIKDLMEFFGVNYEPATVMELIVWFIKMSFGCALFRYVLYGIFWLTSQFRKGMK